MKFIKQSCVLSIAALVTLFIGCASQKPSESAVKELVRDNLRERVPVSWIDSRYAQARNPKISSIEIVEWGNFNKSQKYWAVKIRVIGNAEARSAFQVGRGSSGNRHDFDTVDDFRFSKDDYSKWKISISPLDKEVRW